MIPRMAREKSRPDQPHPTLVAGGSEQEAGGRFSLHRLSAAFARLTGSGKPEAATREVAEGLDELQGQAENPAVGGVISPRMIVEGMLFVGMPDGRPLTNREMAAHIRDVSPQEIDALIRELNELYDASATAYHIASEGPGYRMQIRPQYAAVRRRFGGRVREARLTPQAIEVLSVVAYRQPISAEEVTRLRGSRSHAILSQLVRRGLLCLERPADSPQKPTFYTTDKFNRFLGIDSPRDLPSSEDLDDT